MRFAQISDIHLGYQKDTALQKAEQDIFEEAMDRCIRMNVDFILMPGDIFHTNIPEMRVQKYAFAKFRQVSQAGIPVYVVYGSHDFSPVSNSVIDLLESTGYIRKVTVVESNTEDAITLGFVTDPKTGAKIAGLSGLKMGRDIEHYKRLDRARLEGEPGFKIFMFHAGIMEMKTDAREEGEQMSLSMLPRGFDYYAGGHMHKHGNRTFDGYRHVVYSGTPFAGHSRDLEDNARGVKRGIVIVDTEDANEPVRLEDLGRIEYELIRVDADGKDAASVSAEIASKIDGIDPEGKVVLINVKGEMSSGKSADVDVAAMRERLQERTPLEVKINNSSLKSKEYDIARGSKGASREETIENVFAENISQVRIDREGLTGKDGIATAKELLRILEMPQNGEQGKEYRSRVLGDAMNVLGLETES